MDQDKDNQGPAEPGTPLEPDELAPSPPEFQEATQSKRQEPEAEHPSTSLDIRSGQKGGRVGKPASGTHPTSELDIRRRR